MHDLVDGEGRGRPVGVGAVMGRQFFGDAREPFIEQRHGPRIERRKRTNHARLALRDDEIGIGNDEQRRRRSPGIDRGICKRTGQGAPRCGVNGHALPPLGESSVSRQACTAPVFQYQMKTSIPYLGDTREAQYSFSGFGYPPPPLAASHGKVIHIPSLSTFLLRLLPA